MCMKERVTEEGEEIPFYQYDMDVGFSDGTDRLFLVWPTIVTHEIDERSPLFNLSAEEIRSQRLEIIGKINRNYSMSLASLWNKY